MHAEETSQETPGQDTLYSILLATSRPTTGVESTRGCSAPTPTPRTLMMAMMSMILLMLRLTASLAFLISGVAVFIMMVIQCGCFMLMTLTMIYLVPWWFYPVQVAVDGSPRRRTNGHYAAAEPWFATSA